MFNTFPSFISALDLKKIQRLEQRIGYRLEFPSIPRGWIQSWCRFDLTRHWKKFGLDIEGVDYFTMGELENGLSTRFDPKSKQYQSWIGGYLVRLDEPRPYTLQEHLDLAIVDQTDWLRHYGDPQPLCDFTPAGFKNMGTVQVGNYSGTLYEGGGYSHTDIGPRNSRLWLKIATAFTAMSFNLTNPGLHLTSANFIPHRPELSYDKTFLTVRFILVEIEPHIHAVLYANGTSDTFESIKDEMLKAITSTSIIKIK